MLYDDLLDEPASRRYPRRREGEEALDIDAVVGEVADILPPPAEGYSRRRDVIVPPPPSIVLADNSSYDLLGELQSNDKTHNWQMDFGEAWAPAGAVSVISIQPQTYFRVEKVMATDTSTTAGMGTEIISVMVGNKLQRVSGRGGTMSLFFSQNALGNGVEWDVGDPSYTIAITVRWLVACTFYCTLFGTEWEKR